MKINMENVFGKSWRTALTGWSKGLLVITTDLLHAFQAHQFDSLHGIGLVIGILIVVQGVQMKDAMVTGTPKQALTDELKAAQTALDTAKTTGNTALIKIAQESVDELQKNF